MTRRAHTLAAAWLVLSALPAAAQLLFDDTPHYEENYADQGYWPYTADVWSRTQLPVFDALGNYVMNGDVVWRTEERRPLDQGIEGSLLEKRNGYAQWLNHLVIAKDTYKTWHSRLIVGDAIRTKFSPLTLDLAALNGVRWDLDTGAGKLTLLSSRYDWPNFLSNVRQGSGSSSPVDNQFHSLRHRPTYLLGGHYEYQLGTLNLAVNLVNMNRTASRLDWGDHTLRGVLPEEITQAPVWIAVKVSDGSDLDGHGARVFELLLDGPLGDDVAVTVTRHDADVRDQRYPNGDEYFLPGKQIPPYVEFIRGALDEVERGQRDYLEANGTQYLIYWFRLPDAEREQLERLRFRALVGNDYRISVAEVFPEPNLGLEGHRSTYFYDVAAQPGNVRDGSNVRWVEFEYGRQTGRSIGSLRLELESLGFQVRTEAARTVSYRQFPSASGLRSWDQETADAWFINANKSLGPLRLGGEAFRIDPQYGTSLSIQNGEYRSYSDLLGSPFPEVFPDWGRRYNHTLDLNTVDDNDDKDLFPDFHFLPTSFGDTGVFPGLDEDQDGRNDVNANDNGTPDYLEPFFLYKVDPDAFVYGDDLNNNGIIDHREDDNDADYPYDVDSRGHHLYAALTPLKATEVTAGRYDVRQIWGAGHSRVTYSKVRYQRALYPYGEVDFANVVKRVRDDIRDDTAQFAFLDQHGLAPAEQVVVVEDQLLMANSLVHTTYLDATLLRVPGLRVNSRLKYTHNNQQATARAAGNAVRELAWVLRAGYEWHWRRLQVQPRFKVTRFRRDDDVGRVNGASERAFYPMLILAYPLTERTDLRFGAQGFPFLRSTYRNLLNPAVDYDTQDYVALVSSNVTYEGHVMSFNLGYQLRKLRFDDRRRAVQDVDNGLFFLRLVMGVEPFQG